MTTTTARKLVSASRKLLKAYDSTNTCLQYRIDAEENFLEAERKHIGKPVSGLLHHRAEAYIIAALATHA
jgi:RNA:NAD 2'-phosphotransferase (TPT1/KptA family)